MAGFQRDDLLATIRPKPEVDEVGISRVEEESEADSEDEDNEEELEQAC